MLVRLYVNGYLILNILIIHILLMKYVLPYIRSDSVELLHGCAAEWMAALIFVVWNAILQEKTYLSEVTDMPKKQINTWFTVCKITTSTVFTSEFYAFTYAPRAQ